MRTGGGVGCVRSLGGAAIAGSVGHDFQSWDFFVAPVFAADHGVVLNGLNIGGRSQHFLPAALATGVLFSVGMQCVNVQGMVARDIIARHQSGSGGDLDYLNSLSADAVPAIMSSGLDGENREKAVRNILWRPGLAGERSWLEQSYSEIQSRGVWLAGI